MTLRTKLFLFLVLLVLLSVSLSTWFHVNSITRARKNDFESRAVSLAQFIGLQYVDPLLKDQPGKIEPVHTIEFWINEDQETDAEYIELYNTDGNKLISYTKPRYQIPHRKELTPQFLRDLLLSNRRLLASTFPKQQTFDFLVPVKLNNTHIGVVRIGLDASVYYEQRYASILTSVRYGSVFLLLVFLLAYVVTPYLIQPIRSLVDMADTLETSTINQKSTVRPEGDLEELAEQFNRMANQIKRLTTSLETAGRYHLIFPYVIVPRQLYARITRHIQDHLDVPYVALMLRHPEDDGIQSHYLNYVIEQETLSAVKQFEEPPSVLSELAELTEKTSSGHRAKRATKTGELVSLFDRPGEADLTDSLVFRLETSEDLGYLVLARSDRDFPGEDCRLVRSLLGQINTALSNALHFQRLLVDERSGLYPRKVMDLALEESGSFAATEDERLWLARLRLDEEVPETSDEDTHLKVARLINELRYEVSPLNDTDHFLVAAHDQSSQFLAILSGWDREDAEGILETILDRIDNKTDELSGITLSAGFTSIHQVDRASDLLERGQSALDEAQNQGGNTVCYVD